MIVDDRPTPLVSVIIPVYNAAAYLRETIDSVLAQSYPNIEVLVVDDGSTEDLSRIVAAYGDRVRYVRKPNGGPASARNLGIRMTLADYIAFLDADDVWEPEKLRAQMDMLLLHPSLGLVYSAVSEIDRDGRLRSASRGRQQRPSGDIAQVLFWHNWIPTSTVVTRRACFEQVGGFDEARELISVEDYDMWLRIAERYQLMYLERPLVRYRAHAGGISRNIARSYLGEQLVIEKAVARNAAQRPWVQRALRRRLAMIFFACAHEYFSVSDLANARAYFAKSLQSYLLQPRAWGYWLATWCGRPMIERLRGFKRTSRGPVAAVNGQPKPIRVMHVLFSVDTGGAEHVVLNVARHLDRAAYAMQVCSLTGRGTLAGAFEQLGVPVAAMGKRPGVDVRLWVRLARLLRAQQVDVVHTHNVTPWLYAGVAAKFAGARLVHTEHSNLFAHQWRLKIAERMLAPFTDMLISESDKVARALAAQGVPQNRIRTVVNGVDTARFSGMHSLEAKRVELGLARPRVIVGTVGRLVPVKDHHTLLHAFARIRSTVPDALLVLVGDGPERAALEQQTDALGLRQHVRFLGERTDVQDLIRLFDVFVLSSVSEGLPLTILEAMASGRAIVATNVGGIPEALAEQTGVLVPPKNPDALADAVIALLTDEPRRLAMGARAAQRARQQFDIHDMVQAYARTYHHESLS